VNARVLTRCPQCGYEHPTVADAWACNAIHGRAHPYPMEVRDPELVCRLCGHLGRASLMIGEGGHFEMAHGDDEIRTGHLVSMLVQTRDVAVVNDGQ
jgi:hypothetical protein